MNIKQVAITYVDKLVLVIMAGIFVWAGYQAFFTGSPEKERLEEEIPQDLTRLQRNLEESEPPPLEEFDDAERMAERYAMIPVVQPYRRYVLFRPIPIEWGTFGFIQGRPGRVEIKGVQLIRVVTYNSEHIQIDEAPQPIDIDDPSAGSVIKLNPVGHTARRRTRILAEDIEGVRYVANVIVYEERPEQRPNPPVDCSLEVHRDKVLLTMRWDNPPEPSRRVAEAVGFWIYRKIDGRPDTSYELLNEDNPAVPSARQRRAIEQELRIGEFFSPEMDRGRDFYDDDVFIPEEVAPAPRRPVRPTRPDRPTDRREEPVRAEPAYYLDRTAEPGETYVYRIVAITPPVDGERRESEPWTSSPTTIPSDVHFWLSSIVARGANIRIFKRDHDLGVWHDATFLTVPGMPIGGTRRVRYRDRFTGRFTTKEVDFGTGARLVAAFPEAHGLEPVHSYVREDTPGGIPRIRPQWELGESRDSVAVILNHKDELLKLYRGRPPADFLQRQDRAADRRDAMDPDFDDMYDDPIYDQEPRDPRRRW